MGDNGFPARHGGNLKWLVGLFHGKSHCSMGKSMDPENLRFEKKNILHFEMQS